MATHNYWHMAITYLEEGNTEAPLELYDKVVLGLNWRRSWTQH